LSFVEVGERAFDWGLLLNWVFRTFLDTLLSLFVRELYIVCIYIYIERERERATVPAILITRNK
jgi:hypothetical protein